MNKKAFFVLIITLIGCRSQMIQETEKLTEIYESDSTVEVYNKIEYNLNTIRLHKANDELSLPIINLNSNEKLELSFDDLRNDLSTFYVTIDHYDSDWKKSNLLKSEFVDGFIKDEIIDYEFSFNTLKNYIHYKYIFPSENLKPLISGNYKLKVFDLNGDTIITKQFMIIENMININMNIKKATLSTDRKTKHEIDFSINHPNFNIPDPFSQIKIVIKQNNKDDNAIRDLLPMYIRNNTLIYDYNEENTFYGNNEFRHFDIKSLRYFSDRVKNITKDSINYEVFLYPDFKKTFNNYSIEPDLNGNFYIKSQEARNSDIESEYVNVNFELNSDFITNGDVYIIGDLNNWKINEKYKLEYNFQKNKYEAKVELKQGYYNYHYAINDTSLNYLDVSSIEGTHYQTRNKYQIYVYYKNLNERFERLIGFAEELSKELF